jgi:hypothetical protein
MSVSSLEGPHSAPDEFSRANVVVGLTFRVLPLATLELGLLSVETM